MYTPNKSILGMVNRLWDSLIKRTFAGIYTGPTPPIPPVAGTPYTTEGEALILNNNNGGNDDIQTIKRGYQHPITSQGIQDKYGNRFKKTNVSKLAERNYILKGQ